MHILLSIVGYVCMVLVVILMKKSAKEEVEYHKDAAKVEIEHHKKVAKFFENKFAEINTLVDELLAMNRELIKKYEGE